MFNQGPLEARDKLFSFRNWKRAHFQSFSSFFKSFSKFIFQFLAVLGLCGCAGCCLVAGCGLLIAMTSLVAKHRLQAHGLQPLQHMASVGAVCRLQSWGSEAVARGLSCMWDLPKSESNPCLLHWQAGSLPLSLQGSPSPFLLKLIQCLMTYLKLSTIW